MYAATSTCPDMAFPVAILSQFMRNLGRIQMASRHMSMLIGLRNPIGTQCQAILSYCTALW
jgi:hypothetical protein